MDSQELQRLLDAVQVGCVILKNTPQHHLEAFSRNALYCWRGKPTMNEYKTVKEVCALTGLTRKHLYYFHHEKVVRAVAYANYSVEGYNGYKLYDDGAVEKLQQISLYYQLGLKRDEIRDIMLAPNYDSNAILHTLLAIERDKRLHIDRRIAALEYLVLAGTKNGVSGSLQGLSLDDLGRTLISIREASSGTGSSNAISEERVEVFVKEFNLLVSELARLDESVLQTAIGTSIIQEIFNLSNSYLGIDSMPFILGLFMSVLGDGSVAQGITEQLSPMHARAVIQYLITHSQIINEDQSTSCTDRTDDVWSKTK